MPNPLHLKSAAGPPPPDWKTGHGAFVAGIDEAGRGPLAGPVVAGCVILPDDFPANLLDDSKRLPPKKREEASAAIKERACWGLGRADEKTIDKMNILRATFIAMKEAFDAMLRRLPAWAAERGVSADEIKQRLEIIVDGNQVPFETEYTLRAVVKADGLIPSVMAASIIAKVERDRIMTEYDRLYPEYKYAKHKGYPTKEHKDLCRRLGPSPIQRRSFKY